MLIRAPEFSTFVQLGDNEEGEDDSQIDSYKLVTSDKIFTTKRERILE